MPEPVQIGQPVSAFLAELRASFDADPDAAPRAAERYEAATRSTTTTEALEARLLAARVPARNWPWILNPALEVSTVALAALRGLSTAREDEPAVIAVLHGWKDSGRTGAGSWWIAQEPGGLFVHAEQLVDAWLSPTGRAGMFGASRLFLDDIGQEGGTEVQKAIVREAIDCLFKVRGADLRPTVAATNHDPKAFAAYLGERWSRVKERLVEHGPEAGAGFIACPVEGLRANDRRAKALEMRRP